MIGVLKEIGEDYFKIYYWKGIYRGKWLFLSFLRIREFWIEVFLKECIIFYFFEFIEVKKL